MAKLTIGKREYTLRMDLYAMEKIEEEFGDLTEAIKNFREKRKIGMVKTLFRIFANSGEKAAGRPESVNDSELDALGLMGLNRVAAALNETLAESLHAETVNGNEADDEPRDAYAEEAEAREKNA